MHGMALFQLLLGLVILGNVAEALLDSSPLTKFQPEIGIVQNLQKQHIWKSEHEVQEVQDLLSNTYKNLITSVKLSSEENSTDCIKSLVDLSVDAVFQQKYALQVLDASGKLESGIMMGNYKWDGLYYECLKVKKTKFDGKWCETTLGTEYDILGQKQTFGLSLGMCLPSSCSEEFIIDHLQSIANASNQKVSVDCPIQPIGWTAIDIFSFFIFCLLLSFVAFGTMVDLFVSCKNQKNSGNLSVSGDGIYGVSSESNCASESVWVKVARAFSIIENTKILLNTDNKPGTIDVLHGMRFLSISWVVLGHTYVMTLLYIDNSIDLINWLIESFSFQTVSNASFSVDTFFFLSGLLCCYLGLKEGKRKNGKLNVPLMYLHRYLRLTPAYAFLILFLVGFYSKLGDGPMWPNHVNGTSAICHQYWWTNLLYINNLYPTQLNGECFALAWYLANDMQFFLLAPISIIILTRKPKIGINLLVFGIFSSLLVSGVISSHYQQQPQSLGLSLLLRMLMNPPPTPGPSPNSTDHSVGMNGLGMPPMSPKDTFWSDLYTKPWCRIHVYLIGMITGYILHATNCKIRMTKLFVAAGWAIATALNLAVLYGLWPYVKDGTMMTVSLSAFYNAMSRPIWAVGLAWVVIACTSGYGGPVNTFLSWKLFVPLSRLTYCIYLVHTLILFWWFSTQEQSVHFSNTMFAFYYVGLLFMSIFGAYCLSMLIESPFIRLVSLITYRGKQKNVPATGEDVQDPLLINEVQQEE
ncbi:nose resistant to fluoxetine protein 6-like [Styela clava]